MTERASGVWAGVGRLARIWLQRYVSVARTTQPKQRDSGRGWKLRLNTC